MKKPTRPRATRATHPADVLLKVWKAGTLKRDDWNFSPLLDWPDEALRMVWEWELERELGSGNPHFILAWEIHEIELANKKLEAHDNGTHPLSDEELEILDPEDPPKSPAQRKADLEKLKAHIRATEGKPGGKRLTDEELEKMYPCWKPSVPKEPKPMLKSYWLHELAEEAKQGKPWIPSGDNYFTTIQPIEIDWTKSRTELLEAFGNWLDSGKHPFHTSYKHASVIKRKKGQRKTAGFLAWLRELAIYRISEAGFTRAKGLEKMMVKPIGKEKKPGISPANWEHAQARTRDRIIERLQSLEAIARNMSRIDPARSSPDWRDYFTRL